MNRAIRSSGETILVEWYEKRVNPKDKNDNGRFHLHFSRLKKNAIAVTRKKIERFDCKTNREVKSVHGSIAIKNETSNPISFLFVSPNARKYEARTVNIPKITCGKRIANSVNPSVAIKGIVR